MKSISYSSGSVISLCISLIFLAIALSGALQTQLTIFGFYAAELPLLLSIFFGRNWLAKSIDTTFFARSISFCSFIIILWSIISLLADNSKQSLIFSETRSLIWLSLGFFFCRAYFRRTGIVVPRFLVYMGLLYPLGYLYLYLLVIRAGGIEKLYLNLPLILVSVFTAIYYKSRLSWLVIIAWLPVVYLSLYRQSYVVIFFLIILLFLALFVDLNSLSLKAFVQTLLIFGISFVFASSGIVLSAVDYAILNLYPESSVGYNQIIYKTFDSSNDSSTQTRFDALLSSFSSPSTFPTFMANGTYDTLLEGEFNTRDSGFFFVSKRFGVLGVIFLLYCLFLILIPSSLASFFFGLSVFFLMFVTGSMFDIGYIAASFGILLHIVTLRFP